MSFIGLPIKGDITYGEDRPDQRPQEEFAAILQHVLDQDGISEVRWSQYTPHFNDGDPCVFGANGLGVVADGVDCEDFPPYNDDARAVLGSKEWQWNRDTRTRDYSPYQGPNEARWDALTVLNEALQRGEFDDVLLNLFGDHAEVQVIPNGGIHVESYEHD